MEMSLHAMRWEMSFGSVNGGDPRDTSGLMALGWRLLVGSPLDAGAYLYQMNLRTPEGREATRTGRLILLD